MAELRPRSHRLLFITPTQARAHPDDHSCRRDAGCNHAHLPTPVCPNLLNSYSTCARCASHAQPTHRQPHGSTAGSSGQTLANNNRAVLVGQAHTCILR